MMTKDDDDVPWQQSYKVRLRTNSGKVINEITFRGNVDPDYVDIEDQGQAMIYEVADEDEDRSLGLFVRLQSWDTAEQPQHDDFRSFIGKRIEVTIKVID